MEAQYHRSLNYRQPLPRRLLCIRTSVWLSDSSAPSCLSVSSSSPCKSTGIFPSSTRAQKLLSARWRKEGNSHRGPFRLPVPRIPHTLSLRACYGLASSYSSVDRSSSLYAQMNGFPPSPISGSPTLARRSPRRHANEYFLPLRKRRPRSRVAAAVPDRFRPPRGFRFFPSPDWRSTGAGFTLSRL